MPSRWEVLVFICGILVAMLKGSKSPARKDIEKLDSSLGTQSPSQTKPAASKRPRILVVRAGALGDTLMATPLVRALRHTYPQAYLVFICSRTAYDILKYNPHLDLVVPVAYRHIPAWLSPEKSRLLRKLAHLDLDWSVILESHPTLVDLGLRARASRTIAYGAQATVASANGLEMAAFDPKKHAIENNLQAARPLGLRGAGLEMELYYPPALDTSVQERLARAGIHRADRLVGIHAGWGSREHSLESTRLKSWPPDRFAEVARWLAGNADAKVILTGSTVDRPLAEFIERAAGVRCLNLAGELSLLELAALIRRLDLYLTIDSGPAHMAAALGTPLVTLCGPAIMEQTQPLGRSGSVRILYERVPCAPCYGTPLMKTCRDNICMKRIEVAEVEEAIKQSLGLDAAKMASGANQGQS